MATNPIPTIQKRPPGRFAGTNYVNELADVVAGQSPFGTSGQTGFHPPPWMVGYPLQCAAGGASGVYNVTVGEWLPDAFDSSAPLVLEDITSFAGGVAGLLINQQESSVDGSNLIAVDEIVIAWLLFVHPDTQLPVFGTNRAHAVRYNRFNTVTGEFQETYFYAATREDVPEEAWVTWHQADICPDTGAAAQAAIVTQPSSGDLAYSMGMIR